MAGSYVASARIDRARPHALPANWARTAVETDAIPTPMAASDDTSPFGDRDLAARWQSFRERWSQLTFYLFDAESWR